MSDAKFEGLKGKVKTVRYYSVIYDDAGKPKSNKNQVYALTSFDKDGNQFEYLGYVNDLPTVKTTYWLKDGFKYKKDTKLNNAPSSEKAPPLMAKPPDAEKPLPADPSFDIKFKYGYDEKGFRTESFIYNNAGKLISKRVYEYDKSGNKIKETVFTGNQGELFNDSTVFVYDSKGNVKQEIVYLGTGSGQESDARIFHKYTFEYVKFDEKGNWVEKKVFDSVLYGSPETEPKIVRVEYQEISYHK